jgi:hypothetical protein
MHRRLPRLHVPLPIVFVSPNSEIPDPPPAYFTRRMIGHSLGRLRAVNFVPLPKSDKSRPLTTDIRNPFRVSLFEIRSERSGTETSNFQEILVFPVGIISLMLHIIVIFILLMSDRKTGDAWEPSKKEIFSEFRSTEKKSAFIFRS